MTQEEKITHLENEFAVMKRQIDFLMERMGISEKDELNKAILAFIERDSTALSKYLERGGRIG